MEMPIKPYPSDWDWMKRITPKGYACYRAPNPIALTGKMDDPAWENAPWSEPFEDIEGDKKPKPHLETRFKMLWDETYLYVGAFMEEPHVWGKLTEKNSIIYHDNDFEVFIDPNGDNFNYYEFEMNALNTIWELTLPKPYNDGGSAILGTNLEGLKSAVHVFGTLNNPNDIDEGWSVEIAFPWQELLPYADGMSIPPNHGDQWRINFSRVEWQHRVVRGVYEKIPDTPEYNWVWSPQGIINMHRPERWGYIQFSLAPPQTDTFVPDPTLPFRDLLMEVYHTQKVFQEKNGHWAISLQDLSLEHLLYKGVQLNPTHEGFEATVQLETKQWLVTNQFSKIWIKEA